MVQKEHEHLAYIALGSNLDNPMAQVTQACSTLGSLAGIGEIQISPWYLSTAIGPGEQPDFINGVVKIRTSLSPIDLLHTMQAIENEQGRQREIKWGARTLDLDLLLYDDITMQSQELELPHPQLHLRNFVVYPLADISGELVLPSGVSVLKLCQQLGSEGLQRL